MDYSELSDEMKARAEACKTPEDILALAEEEGYELSEEELAAVSGGANRWSCTCYGHVDPVPMCNPLCTLHGKD